MADEVHLGDASAAVMQTIKVSMEQRNALVGLVRLWADRCGFGPAVAAAMMIEVGQELAAMLAEHKEATPIGVARTPPGAAEEMN